MANNFRNIDLVTKLAVKEFINAAVLFHAVDKQWTKEFKTVGNTIDIRRPVYFEATSGAAGGTPTDIQEATVPLVLDIREKVEFEILSSDLTLEVAEMTERYIRPAMAELVQKLESKIGERYYEISNFNGTPGTLPATFLSLANTGAALTEIGVPMKERCVIVTARAMVALSDGLKLVFPTTISLKAIENAMVGQYAGFKIYESNSLALHTVGVATGTPLVDGAAQNTTYALAGPSWTQSLVTDGWTNDTAGILNQGDVFTIAGVNSVNRRTRLDTGQLLNFSVQATVASGSTTGPATLVITPPMIASGPYQTVAAAPVDNAAITVVTGAGGSSHYQNLAFHKNAITVAVVPLETMEDGVTSSTQSIDGVSIRSSRQANITTDKTIFRFDLLAGIKVQNPDFAARLTN